MAPVLESLAVQYKYIYIHRASLYFCSQVYISIMATCVAPLSVQKYIHTPFHLPIRHRPASGAVPPTLLFNPFSLIYTPIFFTI